MHWILVVGLHLSANTVLGGFETEAQCQKAADRFAELLQGQETISTCVEKGSAMAALFEN